VPVSATAVDEESKKKPNRSNQREGDMYPFEVVLDESELDSSVGSGVTSSATKSAGRSGSSCMSANANSKPAMDVIRVPTDPVATA